MGCLGVPVKERVLDIGTPSRANDIKTRVKRPALRSGFRHILNDLRVIEPWDYNDARSALLTLTELIARAHWREAVTYRDTWPHEYALTENDDQRELLDVICARLRAGEGVAGHFFHTTQTYLFIGDYKYWLMSDYEEIDAYNDKGDYVINRARLYGDRRDFIVQPGDTGKSWDYPANPPVNFPSE